MQTGLMLRMAAVLGLAAVAPAQVGQRLPDVPLQDFAQTEATALEDFQGRLLLIEFFAYW